MFLTSHHNITSITALNLVFSYKKASESIKGFEFHFQIGN